MTLHLYICVLYTEVKNQMKLVLVNISYLAGKTN